MHTFYTGLSIVIYRVISFWLNTCSMSLKLTWATRRNARLNGAIFNQRRAGVFELDKLFTALTKFFTQV